MSAPPTDVLPECRYLPVSRTEAAEIGMADDWDTAAADGWVVDVREYQRLRREAAAWRRLCRRAELGLVLAGGLAATGICVALLAVLVEAVR